MMIYLLLLLLLIIAGPAAMDGRLQVGDQLIEINGQTTKNLTHGEAIELIKTGGSLVRLLVRRGKNPNPAFLDQAGGVGGLSPTTPVPHGRPVSSLSQPAGPGPVSHSSPRYPVMAPGSYQHQLQQHQQQQYLAGYNY